MTPRWYSRSAIDVPLERRVHPYFGALLGPERQATLDEHPGVVFGAWADGRLAYFNPAWWRMALSNEGGDVPDRWPLGANFWDAIPTSLEAFFGDAWDATLRTGAPFEYTYECSSHVERRHFSMRLVRVSGAEGIISIHSLLVRSPHVWTPEPFVESRYVDARGRVTMCANCRRTRRNDQPATWDWVPDLLRRRALSINEALCTECTGLHYPRH